MNVVADKTRNFADGNCSQYSAKLWSYFFRLRSQLLLTNFCHIISKT